MPDWNANIHALPAQISEVEATHWPRSFRDLIVAGDPRLVPVETMMAAAAD